MKQTFKKKQIKIDGHAHIFLKSLAMQQNRRYTPKFDALPQEYFKHLKQNKLNGCFLIQPSFLGTNNDYLIRTIKEAKLLEPNLLIKGVAVLDPSSSKQEMLKLKKSGITGIRLNLIVRELPKLHEKKWQTFLQCVEDIGWYVEVHIEGSRLQQVISELIKTNSRIVIDHFGLPDAVNNFQYESYHFLDIIKYETICVKLSAPYRVYPKISAQQAAKKCDFLAKQLFNIIGAKRLIWGSDWPWTQHEKGQTYADCIKWGERWFQNQKIEFANVPSWLIPSTTNL